MSPLASPADSPPRVQRAQSQSGPLKQILRNHLRTFLDRSEGSDTPRSLPAHITRELHAFVRCGDPTFGFARLRCSSCLFDQLVPFSCKGRGFCPSCSGRRMSAIAAHLTDHVLPDQPLRQWVLSLPWSLRIHLACSPALTRDVGRAFPRAVFASYARRARLAGHLDPRTTTPPLSHPPKAHPGAINFTQRFGSSLALNIHFHALVLDGVYTTDGPDSIPTFHPAPPLTQDEVQRVRQSIHRRINRVLKAHGLLPSLSSDPSVPTDEHDSLLPFLQAASIRSRVALGPDSGSPIPKLTDHANATPSPQPLPPLTSNEHGFSLHAATHIPANDRTLRERLCRYIARPPLAQGRLSITDEGQVLWKLRSPWRDGTKAFRFDPIAFIERLVAITRVLFEMTHRVISIPLRGTEAYPPRAPTHLPRRLCPRGIPTPPHRAPALSGRSRSCTLPRITHCQRPTRAHHKTPHRLLYLSLAPTHLPSIRQGRTALPKLPRPPHLAHRDH